MTESSLGFAICGQLSIDQQDVNVIVLPAGNEETASTRLRALPIMTQLKEKRTIGFSELINIKDARDYILWIQKKISENHLLLAKKLKKSGAIVIYDCDESGEALSYWATPWLVFEMFHLADWITADTPERLNWIKRSCSLARHAILENEIDYGSPRNTIDKIRRIRNGEAMRVLWFGNSCNLLSVASASSIFRDSKEYQLVLCGATLDDANRFFPGCKPEIHQWSREGFLDLLYTCDISILSHNSSLSDQRKSGHKMITSICHGVPVIASATPDYSRIASYAGVEDYLFHRSDDLDRLMQSLLDEETRKHYILTAKPRLLDKYYPGSFADNAISLLGEAIRRSRISFRIYEPVLNGKLRYVAGKLMRLCGKSYWKRMQK